MSRAKSDFVDWASCLHPFGEDPYGPALPHDPVCAAIREARREDDPGLPQGVWERELKRADWDKALSLSLGVLRERSKDMQVAGWACEAALMRYGFASLPGGLRMIAGLCSGFGDGLHPQPEGSDQEARLARLAWLDSTLAERAASLPITEASPDVPAATYADWMAMEHRERIQNGNGKNGVAGDARRMLNLAGTQTSPAFHASLHGQLREALLALDELARAADALCGGQAPSFHALRDRLEHIDARVLAWHPSAGTESPRIPTFLSRLFVFAAATAIVLLAGTGVCLPFRHRRLPHAHRAAQPRPLAGETGRLVGRHDAGGTARRVAGAGGEPRLHQKIARNDQRIAFFRPTPRKSVKERIYGRIDPEAARQGTPAARTDYL
ncbi:MAG: type VI secretion system ImpA family N-terminal domain-containing protein [Bilophila wadsworthia]|uniref:type VI secretion system protein TssA n=1 Tax=Bilophila wadsworthia TaxID=35833 RepID=UPI00300EB9FD